MLRIKSVFASLALVASLAFAGGAGAATVNIVKNYDGSVTPISGFGGTMGSDQVTVLDRVDSNNSRFLDQLDFGGLVSGTINSIELMLDFDLAPYSAIPTMFGIARFEDWRVYSSTDGSTNSATRSQLGRLDSSVRATWSTTLTSGSTFDQAVADGNLKFWFGDEGLLRNSFRLYSAGVSVDYSVAAVPLPAGGLLLLGALGGFGALRRRKRA